MDFRPAPRYVLGERPAGEILKLKFEGEASIACPAEDQPQQ
jgi:hypothetical protein